MFVVLLRFSANGMKAGEFMEGHKEWLDRGFDDGIFLLAGNLHPGPGGGLLAHNTTRPELESRVGADPFVIQDVVKAEILQISPSKTDPRLGFLLG